ncbi:type I restriction enzyme R subunit [Micromonospora palomenae]|uniref:Type I restriction enzyme R subunit n=1 Tax=Micromonospora palomenae TaxID=1461247 RepID=A0A561WWN4_9ACTN|nr:type I restriction endonuclease [Micromonospora palomenae]TWG28249.1 type I restriction enzyme R subunit [Micromonospora palomenae]
MADYNEKPFEAELCAHLAVHGWLYSPTDHEPGAEYDRERAIVPGDVLGWLRDTQPEEFAKAVKAGTSQELAATSALLSRLCKVLDTPTDQGGGTLNVLRRGFKHVSSPFRMCQFKPATSLNPTTLADYAKARVRVMRQVHFSTKDNRSLDLVLFVNGLPVATLELKTDFTQSVAEAIDQYKKARQPKDPGGHVQPLLGFGNRALVHFAVSNEEVWMTTRLAGDKTHFLPFNAGDGHGGKGNAPNPNGSATSYLWEKVLDRDNWLTILGKFCHVETRQSRDPISGAVSKSTTLLFPRYHQWEAVTAIVAHAREHGPGQKYLIQHSAGSGKTNSIAWTAHRLARLFDEHNHKVFDTVIVVTDRTVLDDQLQVAVRQIDSADTGSSGGEGIITTVDEVEARKAGSKSKALAQALTGGKLIVVVTLQTFPFAMAAIADNQGLAGRKFAVIADEAHSSQSGATAGKIREILSDTERAELDDGGEVSIEDELAAQMTARATTPNVSFFAFTATPKAKTLELFGTPDTDGIPQPFHTYTMKQAIEEEFILDVLRGYQTYDTAFQIARNVATGRIAQPDDGNDSPAERAIEEELVDKAAATKGLMRWVKLHPTNISQKCAIIVEHFRENVAHLLDGHAKAMVVTDSRKAAVRYKTQIDAYIARRGYTDIGTLVAFSGSVEDAETGPGQFTETSMNPTKVGSQIASAFAGPEYKVLLVANKFQTGFDQPLLSAMYVDKRLSGVLAVQTLSRLNRTYRTPSGERKDVTFVLDFVNDPEEIRKSFEPYYTNARLETTTDPNVVHDISTKLDQGAVFTEAQVDACVAAWVGRAGNNALAATIKPARDEFAKRYTDALRRDDTGEIEALDHFRKDVGTFVRLYDFMSQVVDYADTQLEKRAIFLRLLERYIRPTTVTADIDVSDVVLKKIKHTPGEQLDITLGDGTGLRGVVAAGSGNTPDPVLVAFQTIIDRLNDLFGAEFSRSQVEGFVDTLGAVLLENEALVEQARVNSRVQFLESPDLPDAVVDAVFANQHSHNAIADYIAAGNADSNRLINEIGAMIHAAVTNSPAPSSLPSALPPWAARLAELEALTPGWLDGGGAAVYTPALQAARSLLAALTEFHVSLPRIYPTPAGWVQFEWHGPGPRVEVTLTGHDHEVFVLYIDGNENTINEPDTYTTARMVSELLGRTA